MNIPGRRLLVEIDDPHDADLMHWIGGHQERLRALPQDCSEGAFELIETAHWNGQQRHAQCLRRNFQLCKLSRLRGIIWIPKKDHARDGGYNLLEELQPLAGQLWAKDGIAGDVPAGSGETRYDSGPYWIAYSYHDYGDSLRRLFGRQGCRRAERCDEVD
jgi:hypothetical protein